MHRIHRKGFTLLEMIVVVTLMAVLMGAATILVFGNRDGVVVKDEGARMIAYLRNAWDHTRATGAPLVFRPNYNDGSLRYYDPRSQKTHKASLAEGHYVVGIRINDRMYSQATGGMATPVAQADSEGDEEAVDALAYEDEFALFISEGRGMARIAVVFAVLEDKEGPIDVSNFNTIMMCSLNLITGKGDVSPITPEEFENLFLISFEAENNESVY
ncbi:pilus assembly FimT family protein [Acanthopleuribacter pedis]|uniref:Prepilin-type N-terminal cleavage/methylation domain-containing protein n=1 Tax=Acanthopleuribacter pedis TaxID=442870 RepID=A0A8J7Q7Z0_9BACT|nr:prepilin-type N-terminal cleavage/methylation domain-containing protein [Acanthopleuribacter pedis]MBO1319044.1 prepilin-type N-terminal cleavage/methylation domain-containing protein [Acanthopleuribacter pedis]